MGERVRNWTSWEETMGKIFQLFPPPDKYIIDIKYDNNGEIVTFHNSADLLLYSALNNIDGLDKVSFRMKDLEFQCDIDTDVDESIEIIKKSV